MDSTLERILSLIPKKENGSFQYGAKKKFCDSIGIPQQDLSDWMAGRSSGYKNKLYEIADTYNVSVEWLKTGKIKESQTAENDDLAEALQILRDNPATRSLLHVSKNMSAQQIEKMTDWISSLQGE